MLAIVGSRKYKDYNFIETKILEWEKEIGKNHTIISGGATGVDSLAEIFAKNQDRKMITFKPDYDTYPSKIAPLMRNTQIIEQAEYLIAFPDRESRGTWDSVRKATKKNIPVKVWKI